MTGHPLSLHVLRLVVMGVVFPGAVAPVATAVFFFSDPTMGMLAMVNLPALMMLYPIARRWSAAAGPGCAGSGRRSSASRAPLQQFADRTLGGHYRAFQVARQAGRELGAGEMHAS